MKKETLFRMLEESTAKVSLVEQDGGSLHLDFGAYAIEAYKIAIEDALAALEAACAGDGNIEERLIALKDEITETPKTSVVEEYTSLLGGLRYRWHRGAVYGAHDVSFRDDLLTFTSAADEGKAIAILEKSATALGLRITRKEDNQLKVRVLL